jgi:hypothetical protein
MAWFNKIVRRRVADSRPLTPPPTDSVAFASAAITGRWVQRVEIRTTVRMLGKPTPENLSDDARDRLLSAFREWHGR